MKLFIVVAAAVFLVLFSALVTAGKNLFNLREKKLKIKLIKAPMEGSPEIEDESEIETFTPTRSQSTPRVNSDGFESKGFSMVVYKKSTVCINGKCESQKCINGKCETIKFNVNEEANE